jgi:hypothetical protein
VGAPKKRRREKWRKTVENIGYLDIAEMCLKNNKNGCGKIEACFLKYKNGGKITKKRNQIGKSNNSIANLIWKLHP